MLIVSLSSMGLPGLNGFVGEFTILLGAFGSTAIGSPWFAGYRCAGCHHGRRLYPVHVPEDVPRPEGSIVEEVKKHGHACVT